MSKLQFYESTKHLAVNSFSRMKARQLSFQDMRTMQPNYLDQIEGATNATPMKRKV